MMVHARPMVRGSGACPPAAAPAAARGIAAPAAAQGFAAPAAGILPSNCVKSVALGWARPVSPPGAGGKAVFFQGSGRPAAARGGGWRRAGAVFVSNARLKPMFRHGFAKSALGLIAPRIPRGGRPRPGVSMEVILHLGAHRTATTSLQAWMVQNEDALAEAGIAVWGPGQTRSGRFAGLIKRPDWVNAQDEVEARASASALRFEIDRLEEAGYRALVISEENCLGTMRLCLEQEMLYPDVAGRIRRIAAALGPHLTGLGLSLRRYDTWWGSVLADQATRGRGLAHGARSLARLAEHPRSWRRLVQILREESLGLPLTVWPFEALVGRPAAQMQALLGATALPPGLYDHLRVMNSASAGAPGSPFTLAQRAAMVARYHEDLAWLAQPRPGLRFIENDSTEPGAHPAGLTEEEGWFHDDQKRGLG